VSKVNGVIREIVVLVVPVERARVSFKSCAA
jgi:hypothetical protein